MLVVSCSFLKADYNEVADAISEIFGDRYPVTRHDAPVSIDLTPDENSHFYAKLVLWSPTAGQTVIMGNQDDGFYTLGNILNSTYGYDITRIGLTFDDKVFVKGNDNYAYFLFLHQDCHEKRRLVRVMQDPRWDFFEIGEPLPFEQTEKYTERIKKKRLTNDMILDYVEAMGYDVRKPDFWKSDNAVYLEWSWIPVDQQNK